MTPRQQKLLRAILDEFINSAEAVGSINLANKYRLGVSPATIRNEMADLVRMGYLEKPHSSSGRVPTNLGFRFLIEQLMGELDELEVGISSNLYEQMFQLRFDQDRLIYTTLDELAKKTKNLSLIMLARRVYYSGLSNLISHPEFKAEEALHKVLQFVEDVDLLQRTFSQYNINDNHIRILVGSDIGMVNFKRIAMIYSPIALHNDIRGYIAVVGPNRMNYNQILPYFDFVVKSLNRVINGW